MRIIWSPLAVERISEISDYLAEDNPDAAITWVESIFKIIERFIDYPEMGCVVPELDKPNTREIIHGNYRIIYKILQENIHILTVRYLKQILPTEEVN
jgi:toxin ParE1/3/4